MMLKTLVTLPILAVCAALALAACYETPKPECAFSCARENTCPGGYVCADDRWCKRKGQENVNCGSSLVDAAVDAPSASGTADVSRGSASGTADVSGVGESDYVGRYDETSSLGLSGTDQTE